MRAVLCVTLVAMTVASAPSVSAQWPRYALPGVPRLANGQVDLDAPTPRMPDGKPDLSGLWGRAPGTGGGGRGRGAATPPAPLPPGTPPAPTFFEVGANFPDGLPYQPWAKQLRDARNAANSKDNPDALCLPMGFMQFHMHGQPRRMIQQPHLLTLVYEANYGLRQIYTDGRALPPQGEPQPWWYGYSVGRWEGDTLVVESNNFRDDGWLDVRGSPYTDQLKLTERFRRPSFGRLEIDVTVDDPKAYTRPWTVRIAQQINTDTEMIEFVCNENQQFRIRVKVP